MTTLPATIRATASGWFAVSIPGSTRTPEFATLTDAMEFVSANWTLRGLVINDVVSIPMEVQERVNRQGLTHGEATSVVRQLLGLSEI
jgi:hypothetical protein